MRQRARQHDVKSVRAGLTTMQDRVPARAIWALGLTQIVGYGTLYYSFSVLAPEIGRDFGWSPGWVYGALTIALLAGGFLAPVAGHLADRFGAARTMAAGSVAAAATLAAAGVAPNGMVYAASLVAMEITSSLVLYATAFAALVQAGGQGAQRSITHLTLIAGFASTLFWPLTSLLLRYIDWQAVYLVFGGLNLFVCAPLHLWLSRLRKGVSPQAPAATGRAVESPPESGTLPGRHRSLGFGLMMLGFAIEGFILSAVLMQIIPLLTGLGLGTGALLVTSLFGPAQVLSRLANMVLGRNLLASRVAVIASILLPLGVLVLAATAPYLPGAVVFAILFGLGSGLISIVSGALPLQLMGRERYGTKLGWLSSARQIASAIAPFCLALLMGALGPSGALWVIASLGILSVLTFVAIALLRRSDAEGPVGQKAEATA
jgi:MFS family permease